MAKINSYLPYLFILSSYLLNGQDKSFTYQHYGPEEGLNNANVWAIKQGPDDLMYFATQNGVYSYDGYNFIKLQARNLKSNYIRNINFNASNLLISNEDGVLEYDRKTSSVKKLEKFKFDKKADELVINGDYVYNLSSQVTITCLNLKTQRLYEDVIRQKDPDSRAFCIFKSRDKKVYSGRIDGLYIFEGEKQVKIKQVKNVPIYSVTEDKDGNLVIGSDNKIIVLGKNLRILKEYFPKFKAAKTFLMSGDKNINKLNVDKYGRFWFTAAPDNSLFLYENNVLYDVFEILNISTTVINSISKDKDENIWISTFNDGVYFIQNPFLNNFSFTIKEKSLTVNEVTLHGDYIITATSNGLYGFNYKTYSLNTLSNPDEAFGEPIYNITNNHNNYYYSNRPTFNSSTGSLTAGKDLLKFHPIESKYVYLLNEKEALIAEAGTIYKINITTNKTLDTIVSFPDYRIKISSMLIKDNLLFIGTLNGLTIADLKNKKHNTLNDSIFNFPINHINLINNKIYIAHEGGFSIYEDKKLITQIGNSITGNIKLSAVKKIKFYDNHIWLATLNGLFMCDMEFQPITKYSKTTGLLSNTINDIVFSGQTACIATDRGISIANTKELLANRFKPGQVKIISYQIDSHEFY
ncbi:MAG TPA: two-component regulator propeller domain-containing protein, partial [Bacteroidia bacterium]|nr:two-component regulator propeller domain-containing protein [Bacteroidia bacterium]